MKIVVLNSAKVGSDINFDKLLEIGEVKIYKNTKPEEIAFRICDAEIVISTIDTPINRDVILNAPKLKMISIMATGSDSVDMKAAKKANIIVRKVTEYATNSVAQHTFAMLLYIFNQIHYYRNLAINGKWIKNSDFDYYKKSWQGLNGKNFGIIGFGPIGQKVASIAEVFGCNVSFVSITGKNKNKNYKSVSLNELIQNSDIISIHAPKNKITENLITIKEFKLMKNTAVLLNLGRGGIVNEKDLVEALNKNHIAYACLDVLNEEPPSYKNALFHVKDKKKLIVTPHIAWASNESRQLLVDKAIKNIEDYIFALKNIKNK